MKRPDAKGDIQARADDEAWDKIVQRRISDLKRKIESGLTGEGLAAIHGLHLPSHDEAPCDVDETSEVDDQDVLRDKIFKRLTQISYTIAGNRSLADDVKEKWTAMLQECQPSEGKSVTLLRDLRREVDSWQEIDPESNLSLLYGAISAVTTMIEIYRRRFYTR
jgi:hypothetical protein